MVVTYEEETILKSIAPEYKYIARDSNGDLNVYERKPHKSIEKGYWDDDTYYQLNPFKHLFLWILWTDFEPYKISDILKGEIFG